MFEDARLQISKLPHWVQLWMRWLNIIFLLGVFFIWEHAEAQWALAAYAISFPIGFGAFCFFRDVRITGLPHLLLWAPLLVLLMHSAANDPDFRMVSFYGIWISLLSLTIVVSVVLDIKGIGAALFLKRDAD